MYVRTSGTGPALLLIHGSATDADTWGMQERRLQERFRVIVYDRRGTPRSPLGAGAGVPSMRDHAEDAVALIREYAGQRPVLVCGSSFGGVCALELVCRRLLPVSGLILCEPPLVLPGDEPLWPAAELAQYERLRREGRGPASAELFLRAILGANYDRLPPLVRARSLALHEAIALDSDTLAAYQVDAAALAGIDVPVLLLGGERSVPVLRRALDSLAAAIPGAELRVVRGGSHAMHADAWHAFNDELVRFARAIGHLPA